MATFADKKIAEGNEHIKEAEKCMKTSLFKWKPDIDGAVNEYTKAATCFKNAKAVPQAKECYIKAAELQRQMNSPFNAAKAYEQAGLLCKENKDYAEAVRLMEMAAHMFQEHGTPDTAALTLDKAAKMVEMDSPQMAIHLYKKACDISDIEDKNFQCAEFIGKAARLMIRTKRYDEAVEALKREIDYYVKGGSYAPVCKAVMGLVLVHLHRDDHVAADLAFKSYLSTPEFATSEEASAIENLLRALETGDGEMAKMVLSLPLLKFMDNAFARLARDLQVPEGGVGAGGGGEEEDEFAGGLC